MIKRKVLSLALAGVLCVGGAHLGTTVNAASLNSIIGSETVTLTSGTSMSYTTVSDAQLPSSLKSMITNAQKSVFSTTYVDGDDMYLVVNYGVCNTGGYSVSVLNLTEDEDSIYFTTKLNGPAAGAMVTCALTYPHLVVKISASDKNVIFDMTNAGESDLVTM